MGLFGGPLESAPKGIRDTKEEVEVGYTTDVEDIRQKTKRVLGLCIILVVWII
jgi:hypothetical protein